jgi:opacity protein-like surface antigen
MTSRLLVAATIVAATASAVSAAQAQVSNVYGTIGYTSIEEDDISVGAITGRLGYQFNSWLAVEGEASFNAKDDQVRVAGINVGVELEKAYGVYGVGKLPLGDRFDIFGRVGYAYLEVSASALGFSETGDDNGLAYGVGVNFWFTKINGARLEYTRYQFDDDAESDVFGIAYAHKF